MEARFGPAGNSDSFASYAKTTLKAPEWLKAMGLGAYEYQCGRGVNISEETARKLGEAAQSNGIRLSLHAPYYINLANPEPERVDANIEYIRKSARAADNMGAVRIVVHTGAAGGIDRREALETAKVTMAKALEVCRSEGLGHITICPETMGKINQLGDLDEVLELCGIDESLLPCVDFGHLYARSLGEHRFREHFEPMFDRMERALGIDRVRPLHIHFSQIQYGKSGEVRHLEYGNGEYGPDFDPIAAIMAERDYVPTLICESRGTQAEDAVRLQEIFNAEVKRCKNI